MIRIPAWLATCAGIATLSCISNRAPGNDREAALDPPEPPAEPATVEAAIAGVDMSLLHPQIMTEADRASIAAPPAMCVFRFTRIGYPAVIYSTGAHATAVMKLNGKLVTLPGHAEGRFESGGVTVQLRQVEADADVQEQQQADLIVLLPGAAHELGYRGFSECR